MFSNSETSDYLSHDKWLNFADSRFPWTVLTKESLQNSLPTQKSQVILNRNDVHRGGGIPTETSRNQIMLC